MTRKPYFDAFEKIIIAQGIVGIAVFASMIWILTRLP